MWQTSPLYLSLLLPVSLAQGLLPLVQLYVAKIVLDLVSSIINGRAYNLSLQDLMLALALQTAVGVGSVVLGAIQGLYESLLGEQLRNGIQRRILEKASEMDLASYEDGAFYDQMQNAFNEAGSRPLQIISQFRVIIQSLVALGSFFALLFALSPWILFILIAASVPSFLIRTRFGNLNYWMLRRRIPALRKQQYFSHVLRTDYLVQEVKLFSLEPFFLRRFDRLFRTFFAETRNLYQRRTWGSLGGAAISSLGTLGAMAFVALAVLDRGITIGDFSMYSGAIAQSRSRISGILGAISTLYSHTLFISNLFAFLDAPAPDLEDGMEWQEPIHTIEFRDVSFRYPQEKRYALKNISLSLHKGETLGIVGPNGAGKTTLIKLLSMLYRPTDGQILLNGKDASTYSVRSIQRYISAVFQNYGRYELQARENIELGDVQAQPKDLRYEAAVDNARVKDDLDDLPAGHDTQLGQWFEQGHQLSGGQWQKVALARAHYRDASLLILDEPTSALDAQGEVEIFQALQKRGPETLAVIISHRLSTMRHTDRVVVLEHGEITELGHHNELLKRNGYYRRHHDLQWLAYQQA